MSPITSPIISADKKGPRFILRVTALDGIEGFEPRGIDPV